MNVRSIAIESTPESTGFCPTALAESINNLLHNCLQLQPNQCLVIFHEPCHRDESAANRYYCEDLPTAIADIARAQHIQVELHEVPIVEDASHLPRAALAPANSADASVFLARCGDQMRFHPRESSASTVVVYAVNGPMMASQFGRVPHQSMLALRDFLDAALKQAQQIRITCPYGTDYVGRWHSPFAGDSEVTCQRFPVAVGQPVPAIAFTGSIATPQFLVGSGSRNFKPASLNLSEPLIANIEHGRITSFTGLDDDVSRANELYQHVSTRYGIDAWAVHSWHAGIHAGCHYPWPAAQNPERWAGTSFGNPRLAHVHTCGDYAPGEISWNLLDPTITLDDQPIWDHGRLHPERLAGGEALISQHPSLRDVLENPNTLIGL